MIKLLVPSGLAAALVATSASAQWVPGSEIVGQSVQVETNGVVNTISFDPGGSARIITPGGNVVPASWTASAGQLCLRTGAGQSHIAPKIEASSRWGAVATLAPSIW
jgi:hypothetical protein